jgi:hypothetical protein
MEIETSLHATKSSRLPTIFATAIVGGALLFVNLDGYQYEIFGGRDFFGEPPLINWTHGWPSTCLVRNSPIPTSYSIGGASYTGWAGTTSRWPFDGSPVIVFWIKPFLIDCAFIVFVLFGAAYTAPRLIYWLKTWKKFSLKSLLAATTLFAVVFAISARALHSASILRFLDSCFGARVLLATKFHYGLQLSAVAIITIGTALTAFAVLHIATRIFRRYRLRWHTTSFQNKLIDAQHAS